MIFPFPAPPDQPDDPEATTVSPPDTSVPPQAGCDNAELVETYHSAVVRLLLAAVDGLARRAEAGVSSRRVMNFLRGNQQPPAGLKDVNTLKVFGVFSRSSAVWLREVVRRLVDSGELEEVPGARSEKVRVSNWGRALLRSSLPVAADILPSPLRLGTDPELEKKLWELRRQLADEEERAPYSIFPNTALVALAVKRPQNLGELAEVPGFGEARIRKYGRAVLEVLRGG